MRLLWLLALAGCGGQQPEHCGRAGDPCCPAESCDGGGLVCDVGRCVACGAEGQLCCGGYCAPGTACASGLCVAIVCGGAGEPCCSTGCGGGLVCDAGHCVSPPPLGDTGAPCMKNNDCAGTKPLCITIDIDGVMWPGGYCTSQCSPSKNDANGHNPACVGAGAICGGSATTGACLAGCSAQQPCARTGYSCALVHQFGVTSPPLGPSWCAPTASSNCDPAAAGSCGMASTCRRIGAVDPMGRCEPACDPFAPACRCYPSSDTGEGLCLNAAGNGGDGQGCVEAWECAVGLTCWRAPMAMVGACRPLCGGPGNLACTNGKACVDLSATVSAAIVGVCGG